MPPAYLDALLALKALPRPPGYALDNVARASRLLLTHQPAAIHVVGTNGKGSVAFKLEQGLRALGKRVGTYTSPHVWSIRERIRLNAATVSEEDFVKAASRILATQVPLSCFEAVTLMALLHFEQHDAQWAVVEAGMGGRDDATNILACPRVVVITSIGMDHVAALGPTLLDIARHKAGAIKAGAHVVLGPCDAGVQAVVEATAAKADAASVTVVAPAPSLDELNERVALEALAKAGLQPVGQRLSALPRFRMEELVYVTGKRLVMDVGHNPAALTAVVGELRRRGLDPRRGCLVFAIAQDKDVAGALAVIAPLGWQRLYLCGLPNANRKAASPGVMVETCAEMGVHNATAVAHPRTARDAALAQPACEFVLAVGSHSLMRFVADAPAEVDPVDMNEG